jgi:hypothetical protein
MKEYENYEIQLLRFAEKGEWREGLRYLADYWLEVRGTKDQRLSVCIGQILIKCGYSKIASNWLFERFMYHPRDGEIMRWLVESAAETRNHETIQRYGEIHEEVSKTLMTPTLHLLNALLGLEKDKRFLEVYNRYPKGNMPLRGYRLYAQFLFYGKKDFEETIRLIKSLPKECHRWTDFPSHLALSYHLTGRSSDGLKALQSSLESFDSNASLTAYEIQREDSPDKALESINSMLSHHGYAPISIRWKDSKFDMSSLSCDSLESSQDCRLVSVLMTVHKMNPMFQTAVRSIIEQTHENIELIIIDDASPEEDVGEYLEICNTDERIRLLHLKKNSGTYAARNLGLSEVKGEFVLFMDSDDWTHPQRIEKALQRLDSSSKIVVAVDSYVRLTRDGSLALIGTYFVRKCMLGLWKTNVVRDELGGFDPVRISADSELLERAQIVYGRESVSHLPVATYFAYFHEESLTGGGRFGFGWRGLVGDRSKYAGAFRTWHQRMGSSLAEINMSTLLEQEEPFELPQGFTRESTRKLPVSKDNEWMAIVESDCANNSVSNFFDVPPDIISPDSAPISVCIATYPGRFKTIARTVRTLLDQTLMPDAIHIWVNESDIAPPLPDNERIVVHLSPEKNLTDIGKFAAASKCSEGITILADDDLNYPPDYIEYMVKEVRRFDGKACVGLHGIAFPLGKKINNIDQYFSQRRVHLYSRGSSVHLPCHVIGTGSMAFDSRQIQFEFEQWDYNRMVDLHVGVESQRKLIPMVSLPRDSNWLSPFEPEENDISIWESVKEDPTLQKQMVEVLGRVSDWSFHLQNGQTIRDTKLLQSANSLLTNQISMTDTEESLDVTPDYDIARRWSQKGRILYFNAMKRRIRFEMPLGWKMDETHPDLFRLAHYLLMSPWENNILDGWEPTRKPGWRPAISYSAGIDSHACLSLLPKNTLVMYHQRHGFKSKINHSNALVMLENLKLDGYAVVRIKSNHELIRTDYGKGSGFSTDLAVGCMSILCADFYGLNGVAFGMPLENSYLFHGHEGRDFLKSWYWKHFNSIFKKAGLDLILPTAGVSEVINLKIVDASPHGQLAESCLRSTTAGKVCGTCWKCFRKNSLRGQLVQFSDEVQTFLKKQPLKQAVSTIFALQKMGDKEKRRLRKFSILESIIDIDVDWLNRYHADAAQFVPIPYREQYISKLSKFADKMSESECEQVRKLSVYIQKEE